VRDLFRAGNTGAANHWCSRCCRAAGAVYRIDNNHQIDFHAGFGLDRNARPISSASAIHSGSTASSDVWSSSKNLSLDRLQALIRPQ